MLLGIGEVAGSSSLSSRGSSFAPRQQQTNQWGESSRFSVGAAMPGGQLVVEDASGTVDSEMWDHMITKCVVNDIYPNKKFVTLDHELDFGGRLQKRVVHKMNIKTEHENFWTKNKESVRKKLARKRNNVQEICRKRMTGEWHDVLLHH